jgi:hypothetical protein
LVDDIYQRVDEIVNLAGSTTAIQIELKMDRRIRQLKKKSKSMMILADLRRQLYKELGKGATEFEKQVMLLKTGINKALARQRMFEAEQLDKLKQADFAGRVIWEANVHPNGLIGRSLRGDVRIRAQKTTVARARRADWMRRALG